MAISAQEVQKLREMTGAGMMDCKKALTEANGDFEAAIDILRKKGQKISASRADKTASEGSVFMKTDGKEGILIALNCETDFVAKNDDFVSIGNKIIDQVFANKPASISDINNLQIEGRTIAEHLTELMGKIGERIEVTAYESVKGESVVSYKHGAKIGVLVALKNINGNADTTEQAGKDVAMQIAAMSPVAVDKTDVDTTMIAREMEIGREQARAEGKPENMLDKIAEGKLNKFFKESTLLNQEFVKDNTKNVQQYLDSVHKGLTVSAFKRVSVAG